MNAFSASVQEPQEEIYPLITDVLKDLHGKEAEKKTQLKELQWKIRKSSNGKVTSTGIT